MKIKWFYLESSSVKAILRAANYPNLYGLSLYNMKEKTARRLFTDESLSSGIFKKQITRLIITIDRNPKKLFTMVKMCSHIFSVFINLTHLTFHSSTCEDFVSLLCDVPSRSFSSSSLLVLNITVQSFSEFLYLVDGRFNQLHTLIVDLINPCFAIELNQENKGEILNLKYFALSCAWQTSYYEESILPLIYRMSNLEKLDLYLTIRVKDTFIDGNELKKTIFNFMPQLNVFTFDIHSIMSINNQTTLPSKEDIQQTFKDFQNNKIISYVDYFLEENRGQCHVYSYPSQMRYYQNITNQFPGGLYKYVRLISLYDQYPFEHQFFIRISQSFPFLKKLSLINHQSQKSKQSQNTSIIKYNYLITLDIQKVHDDYIEQFLFNTKTYFHNNIRLYINYQALERVTHNFTRDDTRINSEKINEIYLFGANYYSESLRNYFPIAKIH